MQLKSIFKKTQSKREFQFVLLNSLQHVSVPALNI